MSENITATYPFKTGDKVRVIDQGDTDFIKDGEIHTIRDTSFVGDTHYVRVEGITETFFANRFEGYVEPEMVDPKGHLIVGRRYRLVSVGRTASGATWSSLGEVGEIVTLDSLDSPTGLEVKVTTESRGASGWYTMPDTLAVDPEPDVIVEVPTYAVQMERERDEARAEVAKLRNELWQEKQIGQENLDTVMDRINAAANKPPCGCSPWCQEFDGEVDRAQDAIRGDYKLKRREQEFTVSWTEYASVSVSRSVTVTATNAEEAEEKAREEDSGTDRSDLRAAIDYGNYEYDDNSDTEYHVERA